MHGNMDAVSATEELYALYKHDVYRYARFSLGSASLAEDIVQEVFLRVLRNWHGFRGDSGAKTWLWRIVRNCIVDHARKQNREPSSTEFDETIRSHGGETATAMFEVEDMLKSLSVDYRHVVVLRLVQGWSTAETAAILGWSEAKVKTALHRAVKQLRKTIAEGGTMDGLSGPATAIRSVE